MHANKIKIQKRYVIGILAVFIVVALSVYIIILNSVKNNFADNAPPSLVLGAGGLKGYTESSKGFLQFTAEDESGFRRPEGKSAKILEKGPGIYYSETDITIEDLLERIKPEAYNKILIAVYRPPVVVETNSSSDHGWFVYPKGPYENTVEIERISNFNIPAYTGFFIFSKNEGKIYGIKKQTDGTKQADAPEKLKDIFGRVNRGWILVSGTNSPDEFNRILNSNCVNERIEKLFVNKSFNEFDEVAVEDNDYSINFEKGHFMVWIKFSPWVECEDEPEPEQPATGITRTQVDLLKSLRGVLDAEGGATGTGTGAGTGATGTGTTGTGTTGTGATGTGITRTQVELLNSLREVWAEEPEPEPEPEPESPVVEIDNSPCDSGGYRCMSQLAAGSDLYELFFSSGNLTCVYENKRCIGVQVNCDSTIPSDGELKGWQESGFDCNDGIGTVTGNVRAETPCQYRAMCENNLSESLNSLLGVVDSVNGANMGDLSGLEQQLHRAPGPPRNVTISEITADSAKISWQKPLNKGSENIKQYRVHVFNENNCQGGTLSQVIVGNSIPPEFISQFKNDVEKLNYDYDITGLTPDTGYDAFVKVTNDNNEWIVSECESFRTNELIEVVFEAFPVNEWVSSIDVILNDDRCYFSNEADSDPSDSTLLFDFTEFYRRLQGSGRRNDLGNILINYYYIDGDGRRDDIILNNFISDEQSFTFMCTRQPLSLNQIYKSNICFNAVADNNVCNGSDEYGGWKSLESLTVNDGLSNWVNDSL